MDMPQWPAGLKRTKPREVVFDVLCAAEQPLDVPELYRRVSEIQDGLAVSTIYRALSVFEEHGLVTKTTMMDGGSALYTLRRADHAHYAICLKCHRQIPLKHCPLEHLPIQEEADGFTITNHRLELYGYCSQCRKKAMIQHPAASAGPDGQHSSRRQEGQQTGAAKKDTPKN